MNLSELELTYLSIEAALSAVQQSTWRGILPKEIIDHFDPDITEKQLRQHMDAMYSLGRLVKAGRGGQRGYRVATASQRAQYALKWGLRPRGEVSVSEYTELVYQDIEKAVGRVNRNLQRGAMPKDVQPWLPYDYRAEGSLRRDMLNMALKGRLVRLDGMGARQGYRLPSAVERMAFSINCGMWPHGIEYIALSH